MTTAQPGAAERLAEIERLLLANIGRTEDVPFLLGLFRDAEQRADRLAREAQHWAQRAAEVIAERDGHVRALLDASQRAGELQAQRDEARATLERVRAALLMGGQTASIRARAALAALSAPADRPNPMG